MMNVGFYQLKCCVYVIGTECNDWYYSINYLIFLPSAFFFFPLRNLQSDVTHFSCSHCLVYDCTPSGFPLYHKSGSWPLISLLFWPKMHVCFSRVGFEEWAASPSLPHEEGSHRLWLQPAQREVQIRPVYQGGGWGLPSWEIWTSTPR